MSNMKNLYENAHCRDTKISMDELRSIDDFDMKLASNEVRPKISVQTQELLYRLIQTDNMIDEIRLLIDGPNSNIEKTEGDPMVTSLTENVNINLMLIERIQAKIKELRAAL